MGGTELFIATVPVVDLPLEELKVYPGRNPRPEDFDDYWDSSLAELAQVNFQPKLVPSGAMPLRNVECFDLWFQGTGGARIHAKYLRPRSAKSRSCPALLFFHGYHGNSGDWMRYVPYAEEGYCVAALDCRGQGGLSEDITPVRGHTLRGHIIRGLADEDPKKLLYRQIFLDTVALARIVGAQPEVDATRIGAMGESQGGGLTLACASLEPTIKAAFAVYPFLCDYQRVWEMDLATAAYEELRDYFRRFDPQHKFFVQAFTRLGYIDVQFLVPRMRAKLTMAVGLMDTICPASTQFAAYNKAQSPKELLLYPDFGHETIPGVSDEAFKFFSRELL